MSFKLEPGAEGLVAGDWIELPLPSFLDAEDATFEVFRLDDEEKETTEKIADAEVKNGVLKITFLEEAAVPAADEQAEGDASDPVIVRGFVDVDTTMASELIGEEASQQSWIAQTDGEDEVRLIEFDLPSAQEVIDAWNASHGLINMALNAIHR